MSNGFDNIFKSIASATHTHSPNNPFYPLVAAAGKIWARELFSTPDPIARDFGPFGSLTLPFHRMGNITSLDLFGMNEMVIFAYYWTNRHRYRRAVDFGANIGLHSILMAILEWEVKAFEPDPDTFAQLLRNLEWNDVPVDARMAAVSFESGTAEFTRVKGNLTGSHLSGAKAAPYGDLETFPVTVEDARPYLEWADFAKIDIEGHEADLICALPPAIWATCDAMVEVGTRDNARRIFGHLHGQVGMFSQKTGWRAVERVEDVPAHHSEGGLFLTGRKTMEWG